MGRTLAAARAAADAGRSLTTTGVEVAAALDGRSPFAGQGLDVAAATDVAEALERGQARVDPAVAALDRAPSTLVPGPVARAVREAQRTLRPVPEALSQLSAATRALPPVLGRDEPRQVLVVLENNAEVRGTGGVVTVFAEGIAEDGQLRLGPFRDVEDVADDADRARTVLAAEDYRGLWGRGKADTTLWKNTGMSPVGSQSSAVLAGVAAATLGRRPTVVVWLDVRAIAAVLEATGPAGLPDGTPLTSDSAVRLLLSEAYLRAPDTIEGQRQRRATLRAAADVVVSRLLAPEGERPGAAALVRALGGAVAGRHVVVWSAVPDEQSALVRAGLAGELSADGGDLASLTFQNLGGGQDEGNKLDFYARRQVTVGVTVSRDEAEVLQEIALRNTAPARGLPG